MKTWFLNLSITRKQLVSLLVAGALPMLTVAVISFNVAKQQIEHQAFNQLSSVKQLKAAAIERYAYLVENQLVTLASTSGTVDAMSSMGHSFESTTSSEGIEPEQLQAMKTNLIDYYEKQFAAEYFSRNNKPFDSKHLYDKLSPTTIAQQYFYISNNSNPLGQKDLLNQADGRSVYHKNHLQYHHNFRAYLDKFGYYDIFLVDVTTGNIVYSVFKELDFATSLLDGPYSNTNLAKAFTRAKNLPQGKVVIEDFAIYSPSYDAAASFAATPIVRDGKTIGVLIFQLPLEPINTIMGERSGMGETGESYLVGEDRLMRSDSYLDPANHTVSASFKNTEKGSVNTVAIDEVEKGKAGNKIIRDYNGNLVLSSYAPIKFGDLNWAIIAEIDKAEAFAGVYSLAYTLLFLFILVLAALTAAAYYISSIITTPILQLSSHIREVQANGKFNHHLDMSQTDEVGDTCRSFKRLQINLSNAFTNITSVLDELSNGRDRTITDSFPGDLGTLTEGVNNAARLIQVARAAQQEQTQLAANNAKEAQTAAALAESQARETLIIKQALDVCDTSVMIANTSLDIVYMNQAVHTLMTDVESQLQSALPDFDASKLMGSNVDQFHRNPHHQRELLASLTGSYRAQIEISGLTFTLTATPIVGGSGERLGTVIEWQNLTDKLAKEKQDQAIADENLRIRQALDNSSTSTMIADKDLNIIYVNQSLSALMQQAEPSLRKHLGRFDSSQLIGQNIDQFHKNPRHQRQILENLTGLVKAEFEVGESTLGITANPIINEQGVRTGTVVEWVDRTAEVAIEKEVAAIITAASNGDFSKKLDTTNKSGFFERISQGLNHIMEQTNTAVSDVLRIFTALSEGDLTQTIDRDYAGDFAKLKTDANTTIHKLREIIDNIQSSSTLIARAADEISSGTQDLSSRTEEQASSLEETASSIEEITQIVRKSEVNAVNANELSVRATQIAREGDETVSQTSTAMNAIAESSNKIANIIGVIDEIAFQTNLLALNAAVEAARAGEQGRGFAVVAAEVRNLAQRSASAAKEIKSLIDDSVNKVANGTGLVESSRKSLASIVSEIDKVSSMMHDITTSAREQTSGIEQVNTAVVQMDQMTQQNAALVEQASAASAAMAEQAANMANMIQFFRR